MGEIREETIVNPTPESAEPATSARAQIEQGGQLDLVFALDCTGSMASYIHTAFTSIESIVKQIVTSEKADLQFGLVAYRDHPPQDSTFITKIYEFTKKTTEMKGYLGQLSAAGGGDGPEAVTAALYDALHMPWRPNATKIVIIIADAPPHGLGEGGDGFPNGDPDGHDPLQIAREMETNGITIFSVACEPALSNYRFAVDFFSAISKITGGMLIPLTSATLLPSAIIGGAREQMDLERKLEELKLESENIEKSHGPVSDEEMVKKLYSAMSTRGEKLTQLNVENPYMPSATAETNVSMFTTSSNLQAASKGLKDVGGPRLQSKFASPGYSGFSSRLSASSSIPPPKGSFFSGLFGKAASPAPAPRRSSAFGGVPGSSAYPAPPIESASMFTVPAPVMPVSSEYSTVQQVSVEKSEITEEQVTRMYQKMKSSKK